MQVPTNNATQLGNAARITTGRRSVSVTVVAPDAHDGSPLCDPRQRRWTALQFGWHLACLTVLAVLAAILGAIVAAPAGAAVVASSPGLHLTASTSSTSSSSYRPNSPIVLRFVVENRGSVPCVVSATTAGSLDVLSATRNGRAIYPSFSPLESIGGTATLVTANMKRLGAGASLAFISQGDPGQGFSIVTPLPDGSGILDSWSTASPGDYQFNVVYQSPSLLGAAACAGESNSVDVSFRVAKPEGVSSRLGHFGLLSRIHGEGLAALIVAALFALSISRLRRNLLPERGRRRAMVLSCSSSVVIVASGLVSGAGVAVASVVPATISFDYGNSPVSSARFNSCVSEINAYDPGLLKTFNGGNDNLTIYVSGGKNSTNWHGEDNNSYINWDPYDVQVFHDGVSAEPCASLYHELSHAKDWAAGTYSTAPCGSTGIATDEVVATLAENGFRAAHNLSLRTEYGKQPLPETTADCTATPSKPSKAAAALNGDPHVITFDGLHYDFQAAGEFTAVASATGDLEIQARTAPLESSRTVSVISAVAMKVDNTRLGFYLGNGEIAVHRNGRPTDIRVGSSNLPGGASLTLTEDPYKGAVYQVTWSDGTVATLWRANIWGLILTVSPASSRAGALSGLFGNFDSNPNNDVADRGGRPFTPTFSTLYPKFANSWRVSPSNSLFDYAKGTTTQTFTDRTFPDRPAALTDLSASQRASAAAACRIAGVTGSSAIAACQLDVALTGSADLAVASSAVEAATGTRTSGSAASANSQTDVETITTANAVAHSSFVAERGQRVYVGVVSTDLPDQCGAVQVRGPDDNVVASTCTKVGDSIEGALLSVSGVYNVYVDPSHGTVGSIKLRVVLSRDEILNASIDGSPVRAQITAPGAQARIVFEAKAGTRVFVEATDATIPDQCGVLQLHGPGDAVLQLGCLAKGNGYIASTLLTTAGQYAVVVSADGTDVGATAIRLISDHDEVIASSIGGSAVTADIRQFGGSASVTFRGNAGEKVRVRLFASTFGTECGIAMLIGPGPSTLVDACVYGTSGEMGPTTLPSTGTYSIMITPDAEQLGSLKVAIATA